MAAGFIVLWASGWLMRNAMADDSPLQETVYDVHKSVGVALVGLFAVRILVRLTCPTPVPWARRGTVNFSSVGRNRGRRRWLQAASVTPVTSSQVSKAWVR